MKVMMLLGYNGAAADVQLGSGASLPLSLKTRAVGDVTIVQCSGRIVAGPEAESLREHVCGTLQDHRDIILHLGEVAFIDSSGLGMLVRLLTSTRRVSGDLKLCSLRSDTHTSRRDRQRSDRRGPAALHVKGALSGSVCGR